MADGPLRLVRDPEPRGRSGRGGVAIAIAVLACAILATVRGADEARSVVDPRAAARAISERALDDGYRAPAILERVRGIRADLGRSPLSAMRRVVYADLLLALSRSPDDTPAAAFHAGVAADLAPVTVPVVWRAVILLTRSGEVQSALDRISAMFTYDATAAAELLAEITPLVGPSRAATAVPPLPAAHVAWASHRKSTGDLEGARAVLDDALRRWPGSIPVVRAVANRAADAGDHARLATALDGIEIPERRDTSILYAYRCVVLATDADPGAAREAMEVARRAGRDDPETDRAIGDCHLALGDPVAARNSWRGALFRIEGEAPGLRTSLWIRIATLDEREGRASDALRAWRRVLELDPDHARARARIGALGGGPAGRS